jgi:glycosyl transferase family 2
VDEKGNSTVTFLCHEEPDTRNLDYIKWAGSNRYSGNNEIIPEATDMQKKESECEKKLPISVIILTFDRAAFILRAVSFALSQCCSGDEVIVVDDGFEDDTEARRASTPFHIKFCSIFPI